MAHLYSVVPIFYNCCDVTLDHVEWAVMTSCVCCMVQVAGDHGGPAAGGGDPRKAQCHKNPQGQERRHAQCKYYRGHGGSNS